MSKHKGIVFQPETPDAHISRRRLIRAGGITTLSTIAAFALAGVRIPQVKAAPSGNTRELVQDHLGFIDVQFVDTQSSAKPEIMVQTLAGTASSPVYADFSRRNEAETADYVIFIDGCTVKAKNGANGHIDYSGRNDGSVLASVFKALASTGGIIVFKGGTFNFGSPLRYTAAHTLILRGDGMWNTALNWTGGNATPQSLLDFDSGGFVAGQQVVLEDLHVHTPTATNLTAINLNHVDRATLRRVAVGAANGGSSSFGIYTGAQDGNSLRIDDCYASSFDIGYSLVCDHLNMSRCQANYGRIGFRFRLAGSDLVAYGLHAYSQSSAGYGFYVDYSNYAGSLTLIDPYSENSGSGQAPTDYYLTTGTLGSPYTNVILVNPTAYHNPIVYSISGSNYRIITAGPRGFAVVTPSVPNSTVDATNTFTFPIRIYILTIGKVTAYKLTDPSGIAQSITTGLHAGQEITLDPGAKIQFTYSSSAPTWKWYGT